ncbi:MAG: signal peptidase II [Gemmatimonadota bacterium]
MSPGEGEAALELSAERPLVSKVALLLVVVGVVLALDVTTKLWIVQNFAPHESEPVLGDFFRLTYTHNRGAAFGINVGEHSRVFFLTLSLVALGVLAIIYRATPAWDRLRLFGVALVSAGAVGNILDRLRYEAGVVDFLDVGIGSNRWPVFNVADMAVSIGAILLLTSFYVEERVARGDRRREE